MASNPHICGVGFATIYPPSAIGAIALICVLRRSQESIKPIQDIAPHRASRVPFITNSALNRWLHPFTYPVC